MSWQLASFALLGAALAVGFAWYERAHPPAKLVALVATLAALAALGRVAFAAVPNVKPTTDIVLIAGFALGAGPGFAVGALAALSSNFFFGQGPWTPWEMLAWGGAGIAGALLARATRGRIGRVPLAAACGVVGLAFGAFMDFGDWVTYSDHSSAWYLARAGTSLPFNVAHAVGNVVFCLAFGPALVRALARFRLRLEVRWRPAPGTVVATTAALAVAGALALGGAADARAATPASYLARAQNSDGGFGAAPGQGSSQLYTGWATLGLAAAGRNPLDVRRGGRSTIDYLRAGVARLSDTGEIERSMLVLGAAGLSSRGFGGRNLRAALLRHRRGNGSFDDQVNLTAFGILALRAAGDGSSSSAVSGAARWLAGQQNGDGGFNFAGRGGPSGVDDTGGPLQALTAAGRRGSRTVDRAVAFLRGAQNRDGGFPLTPGGPSNAQSAAWAAQGLVAAGRDPERVRRGGSRSPLGYLRSLTAPDGSVRYSRTSAQTPVWVTAQALTALARKAYPLGRVARRRARSAHGATAAGRRGSAASRNTTSGGPMPPSWRVAVGLADIAFALLMAPLS